MANARKSKMRDANPQDWLFLNPDGPSPSGITFGVLRKTYGSRINSAAEFGRRKLQPIAPPGDAAASPWRITAEHAEVLPPPGAGDLPFAPEALMHMADIYAVEHVPALLACLTLPFLEGDKLRDGWKRCRDFVDQRFGLERGGGEPADPARPRSSRIGSSAALSLSHPAAPHRSVGSIPWGL